MDIYEWAKENNADYMDMRTGMIYQVQDYNRRLREGEKDARIMVRNISGDLCGHAVKKGDRDEKN